MQILAGGWGERGGEASGLWQMSFTGTVGLCSHRSTLGLGELNRPRSKDAFHPDLPFKQQPRLLVPPALTAAPRLLSPSATAKQLPSTPRAKLQWLGHWCQLRSLWPHPWRHPEGTATQTVPHRPVRWCLAWHRSPTPPVHPSPLGNTTAAAPWILVTQMWDATPVDVCNHFPSTKRCKVHLFVQWKFIYESERPFL